MTTVSIGGGGATRPCHFCSKPTKERGDPALCPDHLNEWLERLESYTTKLQKAVSVRSRQDISVRNMLLSLTAKMQSCIKTYCLLVRQDCCDLLADIVRSSLETLLVFQDCKNQGYDKVADTFSRGEYWTRKREKRARQLGQRLGISGLDKVYQRYSSIVHPTSRLYEYNLFAMMLSRSVAYHHSPSDTRMMLLFAEKMLDLLKQGVQEAERIGKQNRQLEHELCSQDAPTYEEVSNLYRESIIRMLRSIEGVKVIEKGGNKITLRFPDDEEKHLEVQKMLGEIGLLS